MKTTMTAVIGVLLATGLTGCDASEDGEGGAWEESDLTGYEEDVRAVLENTFIGSIEDDNFQGPEASDVLCRFDGQAFTLQIEFASEMRCHDSEWQPADCTHASYAKWDLDGTLVIDGTTYHLTGGVELFNLVPLSAVLTTDLTCYGDGIEFDALELESVITQFVWNIQPDEEHTEQWEGCILNVTPA